MSPLDRLGVILAMPLIWAVELVGWCIDRLNEEWGDDV